MSTQNEVYGVQVPGPTDSFQQQEGRQTGGGQSSYQQPHQQYGGPPGPQYYQPVYPQRSSFGCGTILVRMIVGVFVFFVCLCLVGAFFQAFGMALLVSMNQLSMQQDSTLTEKLIRGEEGATQKVAVITVKGLIMESDDSFLEKQTKQVLKDMEVKAVVLRIDSPGGTITGSDYYYEVLKKMKSERNIPIVVSMGSMATSGGYYLAMAGDELVAERTTITGSIGVIVPMYKGIELCKKIGIESTPITSGPLKTMGSFDKPMTEEQRVIWQRLVDDSFKRFKEVIHEGRPEFAENPEKLDKLATGQIYTAVEASQNGLIDRLGFLNDAIDVAMERAELSENDTKVIRYRAKSTLFDVLVEARAPRKSLELDALLDLTTPRVYLLCPDALPIQTGR